MRNIYLYNHLGFESTFIILTNHLHYCVYKYDLEGKLIIFAHQRSLVLKSIKLNEMQDHIIRKLSNCQIYTITVSSTKLLKAQSLL